MQDGLTTTEVQAALKLEIKHVDRIVQPHGLLL